jgi:hypothetical protein
MTTRSTVLPRSDFLRAPVLATARPEGYKEWHHFVVYRPDWRLLVNFSLTCETHPVRPPRLVPRVIVVAHDRRWTGVVERFDDVEPDVSPDLGGLAVRGNQMTLSHDGYRVVIDLPHHDIRGQLHFTPSGRPSVVVVTNEPVGDGRLNWLFVPRLRAHGWFRLCGREHRLEGDLAYHDHNWGRFRWGDDFGWTWGSVLPTTADDPWSFVFTCRTDRRRLHALAQVLHVWHYDRPIAVFRDAAVTLHSSGLLGRPPDCTLPPPMRLVLGGDASDVPASIEITAHRSGGEVRLDFRPQGYARLAQPSEVALDRSVLLYETSGTASVTGIIDGEAIDFVGAGVFELLHG